MAYEIVKRNESGDPDPSNITKHVSKYHTDDMQNFLIPLARMHNSNLHDWGIACGLEVSGTINHTGIVIDSGVAIDKNGQLISLSSTGHADIGENPFDRKSNEVIVPVHLPTDNFAGKTVYVTIQFSELLRDNEGVLGQWEQVPWVRLQPVDAYDGESIVLAIAVLKEAGKLSELKTMDITLDYCRHLIGESIEELRVMRSSKNGDQIQNIPSGKIGPGEVGGLKITVPKSEGDILFAREDGGDFSSLEIRANVGLGTSSPSEKLEVNGTVKAGKFLGDGSGLIGIRTSQWTDIAGGIFYGGNVGVGTSSPSERLEVNGTLKAGKFLGDGSALTGIKSSQWTDVAGGISYEGNVGIGTAPTSEKLEINGSIKSTEFIGNGSGITDLDGAQITSGTIDDARISLKIARESRFDPTQGHTHIGTNPGDGPIISHGNLSDILPVNLESTDTTLIKHISDFLAKGWQDHVMIKSGNPHGTKAEDVKALPSSGGTITGALLINEDIGIDGELQIKMTGGKYASLTNNKFYNENIFQVNNLKLKLDNIPFLYLNPYKPSYDFIIGHTEDFFRPGPIHKFATNFIKIFSINQNGDLYCAGSKAGYVIDYFINRVGDTLEQGDVVVLSKYQVSQFSGTNNNIPIPEVDLTDKAYDTRVCGIVTEVVKDKDLPHVETRIETTEFNEMMTNDGQEENKFIHPLHKFAAKIKEDLDPKKVKDQQMGKMATLGAFAHCKVDADIAPINVGDLLTTSPTKGHAQKVIDKEKAIGSIIGKALGALEKGRGKIPVMVMLQ